MLAHPANSRQSSPGGPFCLPEEQVPRRAEWIPRHIGKLTGDFFEYLSRSADMFLCPDGANRQASRRRREEMDQG